MISDNKNAFFAAKQPISEDLSIKIALPIIAKYDNIIVSITNKYDFQKGVAKRMVNINLKQLEAFVAVVEQGSFTKAAEALYLAQSTISNHVQMLEQELNVVLLRRESKRSISLTADGQRAYQHAKGILEKCHALEDDLYGDSEREVLIGASTLPSQSVVPQLVTGFIAKHKTCSCVIKNGNSEDVHQMLMDGTIQIGFVGVSDHRQAFVYHRIAEGHLVLITANTPRFAAMKKAGVFGRALLSEPMIFREQGSGTQKSTDNYLSSIDVGPKKLNGVARVSSPDVLRDLVIAGAGVSIVSDTTVQAQVATGELLAFQLDAQPVTRQIYMVYRKKAPLSDMARRFIAYTTETTG